MTSMQFVLTIIIALMIGSTYAEFPETMRSNMNDTIDPCEDFYEYACGGWLRKNQLGPSDTNIVAHEREINKRIDVKSIEIINERHPVLREYWDSCINYDQITELGSKPLLKDLLILAKTVKRIDILEEAGRFFRSGANMFVKFTVRPDRSTNILCISPADLNLRTKDSYFTNMEKYGAYREYINELISEIGLNSKGVSAGDIVLQIERKLSFIKKKTQPAKNVRVTIGEAKQTWPHIVEAFLEGMKLFERTTINNNSKVYIENSDYFDEVDEYVKSMPIQYLKLYVVFIMLHSRVHWLGDNFRKPWFKFFGQKLNGQIQALRRKDFCVNTLKKYFPHLFGKHLYNKLFDLEREENAFEMIKLIKEALEQRISLSSWLRPRAEIRAHETILKTLTLIGKPKVPMSHPFLLSRDDYPGNVYSLVTHLFDEEMKKVGQPVDHEEWTISPAETNAWYFPYENKIIFPVGILQPPLFNGAHVHPAQNFGGIGVIMGHEWTHGFYESGREYDGDGNVRTWWDKDMTNESKKRGQCFSSQYSKFDVHGENNVVIGRVDGNLTHDENIADNGGFALAWDAYRKHVKPVKLDTNEDDELNEKTAKEAEELKVKKAKEGDQMFFLAFGQTWCGHTRDQTMRERLVTDSHSPVKWRVNGVVKNSPHFGSVFNCPDNTPMNPIKKCQLW